MSSVTKEMVEKAMEEYKAPVVGPGMNVVWYAEGKESSGGVAAIVIQYVPNSRYVELWLPHEHKRKRRVRHITDPEVLRQSSVTRSDGAWDHTEFNKALIGLLGSKAPRRAPDPPKQGLTPLSQLGVGPNGPSGPDTPETK